MVKPTYRGWRDKERELEMITSIYTLDKPETARHPDRMPVSMYDLWESTAAILLYRFLVVSGLQSVVCIYMLTFYKFRQQFELFICWKNFLRSQLQGTCGWNLWHTEATGNKWFLIIVFLSGSGSHAQESNWNQGKNTWKWGNVNYVRLDPVRVAWLHILMS